MKKHFTLVVLFFLTFITQGVLALLATNNHVIYIGVLAKCGKTSCLQHWKPTADYLSKEIPKYSFRIKPLTFNEILPIAENNQINFILANPAFYVILEKNHYCQRIATLCNKTKSGAYSKYAGVVFTLKKNNSIRKYSDLKGKTLAAVHKFSYGGWIMQLKEFKHAHLDPYKDCKKVLFLNTHDNVVKAILNNEADVGTVRSGTLEEYADKHNIELKRFFILNQQTNICKLKLSHSTIDYPEWPIAKLQNTSDELAKNVAVALLKLNADNQACVAANCAGWTIPQNYQDVHNCLKEIGAKPYENYGKVKVLDIIQQYWFWMLGFSLVISAFFINLNLRLRRVVTSIKNEIKNRITIEKELQHSEQRKHALLKAIPDLIFVFDKDGRFLEYSVQNPNDLLVTPDKFIGKKISEVFDNEIGKTALKKIKKTFETGKMQSFEYSICINNEARFYEGRYIRLNDEEVLSIIRDITERKKAEEKKLELERQILHTQKLESLGVLAGGIAHDFNNILMGVIGYANLALKRLPSNSPVVNDIIEINKSACRATELAKQMLAYSGKGKFLIENICLNKLIDDISHIINVSISKKAVLKFQLAKNLPSFKGDATQIRQIILNLITNASEALENKSGYISVETDAVEFNNQKASDLQGYISQPNHPADVLNGLYVCLNVTDTGCGMDEMVKSKIFDPFFTTKFTGRGLGMATVLGIVRGHNGIITIFSAPKKGTTFKIYFPVTSNNSHTVNHNPQKQNLNNKWHKKGKILIADDEETICTIAKHILEQAGFTVLIAYNGNDAVTIFEKNNKEILCVILDLTMPGISGEEAFKKIKMINPNVKVIISSGYDEQEALQQFHDVKIDGFIQKPYHLDLLLDILNKIL